MHTSSPENPKEKDDAGLPTKTGTSAIGDRCKTISNLFFEEIQLSYSNGFTAQQVTILLQPQKSRKKANKGKKRKAVVDVGEIVSKKTEKQDKAGAFALVVKINAVEGANTSTVYDSCPEVVKKIKDFVAQPEGHEI